MLAPVCWLQTGLGAAAALPAPHRLATLPAISACSLPQAPVSITACPPLLPADKEALRRQAANAMKAVEMRSLNLLEGGMGAGNKLTRGVPMAAGKPMGAAVAKAGMAGSGGAPMGNGIPAIGVPQAPPPPPPQPQQQAPTQQPQQQANGIPAKTAVPPPQQSAAGPQPPAQPAAGAAPTPQPPATAT